MIEKNISKKSAFENLAFATYLLNRMVKSKNKNMSYVMESTFSKYSDVKNQTGFEIVCYSGSMNGSFEAFNHYEMIQIKNGRMSLIDLNRIMRSHIIAVK